MDEVRKYYEMIERIIDEEIFIGDSESDLKEEIAHNLSYIQISDKQREQISENVLLLSIERIINNRREQIIISSKNHGMYFYLWFDEQACQLRLNLISDFHKKLPFSCKHRMLENPLAIIKSFFYSECHDGIPLIDNYENNGNLNNILNVYLKQLP